MPIKIQIDPGAVESKVIAAWEKGLPQLSEEILADCNEYAKEDTGTLIQSSQIHSRPKDGLLIWQTPYARRQYWAIRTAYKDKNPKASWKWAEVAKRHHFERWEKLAEKALKMNL